MEGLGAGGLLGQGRRDCWAVCGAQSDDSLSGWGPQKWTPMEISMRGAYLGGLLASQARKGGKDAGQAAGELPGWELWGWNGPPGLSQPVGESQDVPSLKWVTLGQGGRLLSATKSLVKAARTSCLWHSQPDVVGPALCTLHAIGGGEQRSYEVEDTWGCLLSFSRASLWFSACGKRELEAGASKCRTGCNTSICCWAAAKSPCTCLEATLAAPGWDFPDGFLAAFLGLPTNISSQYAYIFTK